MFVGHYSSAFIAKAVAPRVSLWVLLLAAQFVDILWALFVFSGVEHVRLLPNLPSNPLDLYHMPYTHSLLATLVWSMLGFAAAKQAFSLTNREATIVAAVVSSHWFLDFLVHRPDLPLLMGHPKLGLALWNYPVAAYILEILLIVTSAWFCIRTRVAAGSKRPAWLAFVVGMLLLQTVSSFGPIPHSVNSMVGSGLILFLLIPWVGNRVERFATSAVAK